MTQLKHTLLGLAWAVTAGACAPLDIGSECPNMSVPDPGAASLDGDVLRAQSPEIVEFDARFPCESAVCVATVGRGAYCSRECEQDRDCPSAFECRPVMTLGPWAGRRFCTWRECVDTAQCGDGDDYQCADVEELSLGSPRKLCAWR